MGRAAEAAGDARRSLVLAREIADPVRQAAGPGLSLSLDADYAGDYDDAVRLARQAGQIAAGVPGSLARMCSGVLSIVLADAWYLVEAERVGARAWSGPGRGRPADQVVLLPRVVDLDLDLDLDLGPGLALATPRRTCGNCSTSRCALAAGLSCSRAYPSAATCAPRPVAAPRPSRSGPHAPQLGQHEGRTYPPWLVPAGRNSCARPGRRWDPAGRRRPRSAARAMSMDTAAEYALMLTDPGPPRPAPGPGKLSARERERGRPGRPGPHRRPDRR